MTYLLLNAVFLGMAAVVAALALGLGRVSRLHLSAVAMALVVVLTLTAIFDNVMIAAGLFTYQPSLISGLRLGVAPIEDFAYPLAAVLLLPALWRLLGGFGRTRKDDDG